MYDLVNSTILDFHVIQLEERAAVYAGRAKCGAALRYEEEPPDSWQRMAEASFKIAAAAATTV